MINWLITTASAHDGEVHAAQPEIGYATFGLGAQIATIIILFLIVAVGGFLLIYFKNKPTE